MNKLMLSALASLLLVAQTGCHQRASVEAPSDFAVLEATDAYDYRAANASGVVLAVRAEQNDPRGSLDFWSKALSHQLTKAGYTQTSSEKITSNGGLVGRRLSYETERRGRKHLYVASVFVTPDKVFVVEAGGDEAYFDQQTKESIDRAVSTLAPS